VSYQRVGNPVGLYNDVEVLEEFVVYCRGLKQQVNNTVSLFAVFFLLSSHGNAIQDVLHSFAEWVFAQAQQNEDDETYRVYTWLVQVSIVLKILFFFKPSTKERKKNNTCLSGVFDLMRFVAKVFPLLTKTLLKDKWWKTAAVRRKRPMESVVLPKASRDVVRHTRAQIDPLGNRRPRSAF
jgi:hypothetical protein